MADAPTPIPAELLDTLLANARANEAIMRKLFRLEVQLLSSQASEDICERLLQLIQQLFDVPMVWFVLEKTPALVPLLKSFQRSTLLRQRLTLQNAEQLSQWLPQREGARLLNQDLGLYHSLLPSEYRQQKPRSMAIIPLTIEGKRCGALLQASADAARFNPNQDTFFLDQLGVKSSLYLSNGLVRQQLAFYATRDALTGLRNRRELDETLPRLLSLQQRHAQPMAVLFIDCDDFKQVNDQHGHATGDKLLIHLARQLEVALRQSDLLFRFAGDEFVVLLPHETQESATQLAARLQQQLVLNPLQREQLNLPIAISVGAAASDQMPQASAQDLLQAADQALYRNKQQRKASKHRQ
ncbi:GGDEF domain-containing protein [Atopomonas sediminilitoris]|uniref:GGDEF domain-containing protein n=1 Tax=Atopomonas sediminilitoris TaxID=2919919 RepID=UPI001F4E8559|nr:sensor domain-containing diguanylate cyclase [Atopomonas sediminilitoris]MCJ8168900.1 DUF484 family protein [Atopomonas sediminilitoris]